MTVMFDVFLPSDFTIHKTSNEKAVPRRATHMSHLYTVHLEAYGHRRHDAEHKQNEEV